MESSIFSIPFFLRGKELPVAVARFEERHWTDVGRMQFKSVGLQIARIVFWNLPRLISPNTCILSGRHGADWGLMDLKSVMYVCSIWTPSTNCTVTLIDRIKAITLYFSILPEYLDHCSRLLSVLGYPHPLISVCRATISLSPYLVSNTHLKCPYKLLSTCATRGRQPAAAGGGELTQ